MTVQMIIPHTIYFEGTKSEAFREGDAFSALIPFSGGGPVAPKPMKVHILQIIPSRTYKDHRHIMYKVFGKHKQYWHEFICEEMQMIGYKKSAENYEKMWYN